MCEYVYINYTIIIKQKFPVFNLKLVLYIIANIIITKVLCKLTTTVVIVVKAQLTSKTKDAAAYVDQVE